MARARTPEQLARLYPANGAELNVVQSQDIEAAADALLREDAQARCKHCNAREDEHEDDDHPWESFVRANGRGYVEAYGAIGWQNAKRLKGTVYAHEIAVSLIYDGDFSAAEKLDYLAQQRPDRRSTKGGAVD